MDFEKLIVWQRSKDLAVGIYREFARCGDFGFKDQITRSALSVPSNIAEGMERRNAKEKIYFLWVAKGSCGELRTQILIARDIAYVADSLAENWVMETRELSRMLGGLINKISD
ncbi:MULTISPECIES: four helix bundle protein [Pseudomonas]|jgi:four helix bundle protein|uniref:Four helix bundle protein n=1 Tax=Pseudomonas mediterranea TaxID=183795 RepID=A0AAX2DJF3_9PSED|nr:MULTISPECIES: four helix bundle protein [Pseudomonas]KGU86760.1 S23 ribosomal protein [Pseudomonas mediterranea CFBP 5447]MBD0684859.1 four helix bundle protein [Pseudomonas sp. PSB18]MBL0840899.1 four helix bundle protein [Pseudomonas mediterranea]MDU9028274.1 four helix bundle protein [Pseudomonas mediterranea]QHA80957.1 four helix bundle protein [Pseudomonas mediterranea]